MKKISLAVCLCAQILFAQTDPIVELIVSVGNIMKQKHVNEIMFFEGVTADKNRVISMFVLKPQDRNSQEQKELIDGLRRYEDAKKEFMEEVTAKNKETLCKNKLLAKLKEIDLVYVYRFRFENEQETYETSIKARECQG